MPAQSSPPVRFALLAVLPLLLLPGIRSAAQGKPPAHLQVTTTTVKAAGKSFSVRLVRARLSLTRLKVGLGAGHVGGTEALGGIAKRYNAIAAINGSFFDAYTDHPIKNPHHTLITGSRVVHKGDVGSMLLYTPDGDVRIDRFPLKIEGALDGSYKYPDNWYAYWINRNPEQSGTVTIFTRDWGPSTGQSDGTQVVVSDGVITRIGHGAQAIPKDGYVIYFRGGEEGLANRFRVGRRCEYRVIRRDGADPEYWRYVQEGLGAGPRLVRDGQVSLDPTSEGFSHAKILSMAGARSMVGVTRDGWLLMATSSGTVRQMADVMKALGAVDAMNLDGGASSGLWAANRYMTTPGRLISNALLVLPR